VIRVVSIAMMLAAVRIAAADDAPAPAPPPAPTPAELAARIDELEAKADKVDQLEQRVESMSDKLKNLIPLRRYITAYIDVGWFAVGGNGAGVRPDVGHREVSGYGLVPAQWVLIGDPLSTAINALGEPADLGATRALHDDTINSEGHPAFVVNSLALAIGRTISHGFSISALAELLPRPGPDVLDVELAHIDYRPTNQHDLVFSIGKIDSVLGVEYRAQDAPRRLTVTPSLACKYTCGRPYGVSARLVEGRLSASASITNGDNFDERFEPDAQYAFNRVPTTAGHLQWMVPLGDGLELGVSGAIGPQDGQTSTKLVQWHFGFDLKLRNLHGVDVTAEYVQGKQPGSSMMPSIPCDTASCLTYKVAYLLASYRVNSHVTPYARVDWRSARHQDGIDFLYVTHTLRSTVGVNVAITSRIIAKAEYTANRELGTFQFPNDVFTTSLVVSTD
jgi:hypothetical protein